MDLLDDLEMFVLDLANMSLTLHIYPCPYRQKQWLDLQDDLETFIRLTDLQPLPAVRKGVLVMARFPFEEHKYVQLFTLYVLKSVLVVIKCTMCGLLC